MIEIRTLLFLQAFNLFWARTKFGEKVRVIFTRLHRCVFLKIIFINYDIHFDVFSNLQNISEVHFNIILINLI